MRLVLGVLGVLVIASQARGTITFERTYGGTSHDIGYSVRQTSDGGYILAGGTESFGAEVGNVYVVKTDSLGDTLWTRMYGDTNRATAHEVQQTADGGYVIAGQTRRPPFRSWDVYLIKTDPAGDTVWTRTYGGSDWDHALSVQQTLDGGYIVAGETWSFGAGLDDVYLIKTDSLGDTLWTRVYGGPGDDGALCVRQTSDSGYIVIGHTRSFGVPLDYDVWLLKTDSSGDTVWTRIYGDSEDNYGDCVQQTSDGGYIIAGHTRFSHLEPFRVYLIKTDPLGDTIWTTTHGDSLDRQGLCVQQTRDGGYIVVVGSPWIDCDDVHLAKMDSIGGTTWTRTYGGVGADEGHWGQQTSDGGYIVVGLTFSFGAGRRDVYLIKTDENGFGARSDVGTASVDAPSDTVACGDTVAVCATVCNYGSTLETFDVGALIDSSGVPVYGDTLTVVNLMPGDQDTASFADWLVPLVHGVSYTVTVTTLLSDTNPGNDTAAKGALAWCPAVHDVGTDLVFDPPDTVACEDTVPVAARVCNYGDTVETFDVEAIIDSGGPPPAYGDTVHVTALDTALCDTVTFASWVVPDTHAVSYTVTVRTLLSDFNPGNDTAWKSTVAWCPPGIEEVLTIPATPSTYGLGQPRPNPAAGLARIAYQLPAKSHVSLRVYDLSGTVVRTLVEAVEESGFETVVWDGRDSSGGEVPSGVYFCRLTAGDFTAAKKVLIVR